MFLALLLAVITAAADTFRPPVPIGIGGSTVIRPAGPIRIPPVDRKWVEVRSRHFTIVSTANERTAREAAAKLEVLTAALGRVYGKFASQPDNTRVFLFGRSSDARTYIDFLLGRTGSNAPGMFIANYDGTGTMIIDASRSWGDRTVFHELIHNLLASGGSQLPMWLEEGLAEYFSSADIRGSFVVVGQPLVQHQRWLRARPLTPLREIFGTERGTDVGSRPWFYIQSWGVVDWMMRAGLPRFDAFIREVERGVSADAALQEIYAINSTMLERLLKRAPMRPPATTRMNVEADVSTESAPLSRGEALHDLGDFLSQMESARVEAERHFREAMDEDPTFGRAQAGIGTLLAREKKYDEAVPYFENALRSSPNDADVCVEYGEALLRNAIGPFAGIVETGSEDVARFRAARLLGERALALGGERGRAQAIVGISYAIEKDVDPGIAPLEEALAAHPLRVDVALMLYAFYLRSGDRARADVLFERRLARSHHPQARFAARAVFVRERMTTANELLARGQTDEAASLVRELIKVTPEAAARFELERELDNLEQLATINRQVVAFNQAVVLANRGENQTALIAIEELLKSACDDNLVRDASALRAELQRRLGMRGQRPAL